MTNEEFLKKLANELKGKMPQEDLQDVIAYHLEYFSEAGPDAAGELDPPEVIAQRVLEEYNSSPHDKKKKKNPKLAVLIVLIVAVIASVQIVAEIVKDGGVKLITKSIVESVKVTTVMGDALGEVGSFITSTVGERTKVEGKNLVPFAAIRVDGEVASKVTVRTGDSYSCVMEFGPREDWDYKQEEDALILKGRRDKVFGSDEEGGTVEITVPEGVTLRELELDLKVGTVSVEGLALEKGEIEVNVGDVTVSGVTGGELAVCCNVGNVTMLNCAVREKLEGSSSMGNVEMSLAGTASDWAMELKSDMGSVKVDGRKVSSPYRTDSDSGSASLEASTNMGNVTVRFKN